jgi:hypothetical protein
MKTDNIAGLCYELYKQDWLSAVPTEIKKDALKDWYQEEFVPHHSLVENAYTGEAEGYYDGASFEEWIEEHGYPGVGCYVSFGEFLKNEFLERVFIKRLLDNDALYAEYLHYLKEVA